MKALEFCEQCQIYHNVIIVDGKYALVDCQRRIKEQVPICNTYPNRVIHKHHPQQYSPISNNSYLSINNHFSQRGSQQNQFTPLKTFITATENKSQFNTSSKSNVQPKNIQSNNLGPRIIASPIQQQPPKVQPAKVVLTKPNSPIFDRRQTVILTTIPQQKFDGSQRSMFSSIINSHKNSKRGSFDQKLPTARERPSISNKYDEAKQTKDEVVGHKPVYVFKNLSKRYSIQNFPPKQEEKLCWCW